MPNYQRGTDLKHCPDGCEWLAISSIPEDFMERLDCWAKSCDTCPREQAEVVVATCAVCEWFQRYPDMGDGECFRFPEAIWKASYSRCGEWKERTNG